MTHGLVNRAAVSPAEAVEILKNESGAKFNPDIVKKFINLPLQDIERLSNVKMFNSI
jgi:response regulator RpfG family c-di-GMP phosphodiesterase